MKIPMEIAALLDLNSKELMCLNRLYLFHKFYSDESECEIEKMREEMADMGIPYRTYDLLEEIIMAVEDMFPRINLSEEYEGNSFNFEDFMNPLNLRIRKREIRLYREEWSDLFGNIQEKN